MEQIFRADWGVPVKWHISTRQEGLLYGYLKRSQMLLRYPAPAQGRMASIELIGLHNKGLWQNIRMHLVRYFVLA